ncbi:MAG TPA: hypothetical protein VFE71_09115 [Bacteroidales bacterium]|nr:hypothetical protein [Bacteroidales bacterium]
MTIIIKTSCNKSIAHDQSGMFSSYKKFKMTLTVNSNKYKFVRFLKRNKVFSKFERNRKDSNKRFNSIESLKKHLEECDRQLAVYLGSAFAFGLTYEGKEFWKNLNLIWVNETKIPVILL